MDFRGRYEKDRDERVSAAQNQNYKQMYQQVLAENEAFRAKLGEITASHGELQAQMADLLTQFELLKSTNNQRAADLLQISQNMEAMVATAYEQQSDVLTRFKADIAGRLGAAKAELE
ncbi:hypothetical protein [Halocynthiibacter sp.]|uniref:hypothetical protein n=1 Tax=Halocynthiibacter sp. TaxID=1979210 RepID=UPI003C4D036F